MPNQNTVETLVDGQLAIATVAQTGTIVSGRGDETTIALVETDSGKQLVVKTFDVGSGGGSVDENKVIVKTSEMPAASSSTLGKMYIYSGESGATYKHGFVYEGASIPANTETVTFADNTISCSGSDFWDFWKSADGAPDNYTEIVKGEMLLVGGNTWRIVGRNNNDEIVDTYQQYDEDWESLGFTFSGTFSAGDMVSFECAINDTASTAYWLKRIDLQPIDTISSGFAVDSALSLSSQNPVQNKVITAALNNKQGILTAGENINISPMVQSIEVSGFSNSDYLNTTFTPGTVNSFEYQTVWKTPSNFYSDAQYNCLFASSGGTPLSCPSLAFDRDNQRLGFSIAVDAYTWGNSADSSVPWQPNTTYYLKATWDGSTSTLYRSTDGETYETLGTASNSTAYFAVPPSIGSTYGMYHAIGTIVLSKTIIKINGNTVFDGATAVSGTDYTVVGNPTITTVTGGELISAPNVATKTELAAKSGVIFRTWED